ncbi:MAG TPA: ABC transporter permease subunit [Stellaceae bacterium]|jgi:iron(III) transport system permease protein|nr:ABC transporter permease subunit [Stellaceae bacterium]
MRLRLSGLSLIYGLALIALASVLVSLLGNILASLSVESEIGRVTLHNFARLLGDPDFPPMLCRTLIQGGGTVVVMLFFSLPIAWLVARTDMRGKGMIVALLTAKLAIPGFITAMAYVWLLNPNNGMVNALLGRTGIDATPLANIYGLGWICFLQGVVLVPACVFLILPAFFTMDGTLEEAAWVSGVTRWRTLRGIVIPLLAPALLAAMLFFFVVAIEVFDFVGLIGMPGHVEVLSLWIYDATHPVVGLPDYGFAGAAGMAMFALSGTAIACYVHYLKRARRFAVLGGKARQVDLLELGKWRWAAHGFVGTWLLIALGLPIATLLWTALVPFLEPPSTAALAHLTLNGFVFAFTYMGKPLVNTLLVMAISVLLTLLWGASVSWVATRSRSRFGQWLDALIFLSPAVPSMVAAVAFQMMGIALHRWIPLYGSIWLIAIAMATRLLAFGTRTVNAAAFQINPELDEAAYASGVSRGKAFRRIFLPMVTPALFYAAIMAGMLSARELTLPLMIDTGHASLVSTLIFNLQTNGNVGPASAVGLYMIVLLLALVLAARWLGGFSERGITSAPPRGEEA